MKFGLSIPTCMEGLIYPIPFFKEVSDIVAMCQEAEDLDFDSVWGNEHVTRQTYVKRKWPSLPRYLEPLIVLAHIAAKTEKIRLGTAIIPLSLRDPILLARQISALDNLSQGRFILGVGLGAYREEFEAQNISKKINRGEMLDEALEALIRLLLHDKASFKGKYHYFHEIEIWPKPIQNPLPIYIGGNSLKNAKRAVKYRIGWMPAGLTPEEIRLIISARETHNQLHGGFSNIEIAPQLTVCIAESNEKAIRIYKNSQIYEHDLSLKESTFKSQDIEKEIGARDLIGTVDEIIKRIENYRRLGINYLPALIFINDNIESVNKSIHLFADEVMPSFI